MSKGRTARFSEPGSTAVNPAEQVASEGIALLLEISCILAWRTGLQDPSHYFNPASSPRDKALSVPTVRLEFLLGCPKLLEPACTI